MKVNREVKFRRMTSALAGACDAKSPGCQSGQVLALLRRPLCCGHLAMAQQRTGADRTAFTCKLLCCRLSQEYLYREEFESYVKEGVLAMHTAFSREQETGLENCGHCHPVRVSGQARKIYVQHRIVEAMELSEVFMTWEEHPWSGRPRGGRPHAAPGRPLLRLWLRPTSARGHLHSHEGGSPTRERDVAILRYLRSSTWLTSVSDGAQTLKAVISPCSPRNREIMSA